MRASTIAHVLRTRNNSRIGRSEQSIVAGAKPAPGVPVRKQRVALLAERAPYFTKEISRLLNENWPSKGTKRWATTGHRIRIELLQETSVNTSAVRTDGAPWLNIHLCEGLNRHRLAACNSAVSIEIDCGHGHHAGIVRWNGAGRVSAGIGDACTRTRAKARVKSCHYRALAVTSGLWEDILSNSESSWHAVRDPISHSVRTASISTITGQPLPIPCRCKDRSELYAKL